MRCRIRLGAHACFITAAVLAASATAGMRQNLPPDLARMVETERDFARTALVKGIRDAFLDFFSDDAIALAPEPVSAKARLRGRPPQPPSVQELKWEPRTGDVAASGELGWLTGPATLLNRAAPDPKPQYSNYLSVWRKEQDGHWRVLVDFGISVPEPVTYAPGFVRFPFEQRYKGTEEARLSAGALLTADRDLNAAISTTGPAAYRGRVTNGSRLNRNGSVPIVGIAQIVDWLERNTPHMKARATASATSRSADLGYTYGTYDLNSGENGAYLRIWMRDARARWWVVADVTQPGPKP